MLRTVLLAAGAGLALAACPNQCSGHGTCSQNDLCTCHANWEGADCSLRTCPFGNSWALDSANPHAYEECSGAGLCDRTSGECKCFDGYSGFACQRRACPNDCSGHGVCRLLGEVKTAVPYPVTAWDADHIQACVCDAGFFGTDCSQRRCPSGDDPLTLCSATVTGQVQEIKVSLGSALNHGAQAAGPAPVVTSEGMDLFGVSDARSFDVVRESADFAQLRVGTTDATGSVFYAPTAAKAVFAKDTATRAAGSPDPGAQSLEVALENIAGFKVRNVHVSAAQTLPVTGDATSETVLEKRYLVTYVPYEQSSANYGVQPPLVCDSGYSCSSAGCSPVVRMPFLYRYAATPSGPGGGSERPNFGTGAVPGTSFEFYTGAFNTASDFAAGKFLRLADKSMPRLPVGATVDTGVSATSTSRYDIRVVVAVQDPSDPVASNDATDVYWTKVVYGNTNITTDVFEYDAATTPANSAGVWSAAKAPAFTGSLLGFTYRGFIPATLTASIPDAPGVVVEFPSTNLVTQDSHFRFFEILVKLPACTVTPMLTGNEFKDVSGADIKPVDANVENAECSNRGQCNRETGMCECFAGFFGPACGKQSTLV